MKKPCRQHGAMATRESGRSHRANFGRYDLDDIRCDWMNDQAMVLSATAVFGVHLKGYAVRVVRMHRQRRTDDPVWCDKLDGFTFKRSSYAVAVDQPGLDSVKGAGAERGSNI